MYDSPLGALALHVMLYGVVLGCRPASEKGSVLPVELIATLPVARTVPAVVRETVTEREPEVDEMAAALAMTRLVNGASTMTETKFGSVGGGEVASSGRYGRTAGAQRKARSGEVEVAGMRNWPPGVTGCAVCL